MLGMPAALRALTAAVVLVSVGVARAEEPPGDTAQAPDRPPAGAEAAVGSGHLDRDDLAAFIDGFVTARMEGRHVAGVTVSVVQGGALIFARGYGFDDVAAGRPVQADRSMFRPGSISKTFTWTAVMQLVEQGKLDLDADVRSYLSDLDLKLAFDDPLTLADLMAQAPGFEDSAMGHLFENDPDRVQSLRDYLRTHQPAQVRPPGVEPAYSNYGTALAGYIVARVSGLAWEDYAEQRLLRPLGMNHSTFREPWGPQRDGPMAADLAGNVSKGYSYRDGEFKPGTFEFIGAVGPAGALSTTASDMARWMLVHLQGGTLDGVQILAPETAALMHRQHFSLNPLVNGMAHGFIESRVHGYRAIGHGGGTVYFLSDMQLIPELDLGVFISTNTSAGGGELISEFVRALVERYFPEGPDLRVTERTPAPQIDLAPYAGAYLSTRRSYTTVERAFNTPVATISVADGGQLLLSALGNQTRLTPVAADTFIGDSADEVFVFRRDAAGNLRDLLLPIPVMVMERVGPLENPQVLQALLIGAAVVLLFVPVGAWLRRRHPLVQSVSERWAAATAVITALVWFAFYTLVAVSTAPMAEDFSAVFFAFPSPLFVAGLWVGLAGAVLTVLSTLLLYAVWTERSWPFWRRVRHTGVVAAALVTLLVLRDLNAIGFNYFS
ncbi:MAG: serine hydrolase domain-containing protein [Pseudomonadales bacterium]